MNSFSENYSFDKERNLARKIISYFSLGGKSINFDVENKERKKKAFSHEFHTES